MDRLANLGKERFPGGEGAPNSEMYQQLSETAISNLETPRVSQNLQREIY